ncbi:hypothetical protein MRB53_042175 [Persea americana]|nr:hypothetical protein MRB53_042175 [Persea americana]
MQRFKTMEFRLGSQELAMVMEGRARRQILQRRLRKSVMIRARLGAGYAFRRSASDGLGDSTGMSSISKLRFDVETACHVA